MPRRYSIWDKPSRLYRVYETSESPADYNLHPPSPTSPPHSALGDPPEAFARPLPFGARYLGVSPTPEGSIAVASTGWGPWGIGVALFALIAWVGTRRR